MPAGAMELVEFQSTGEGRSFTRAEAMALLDLGLEGCGALMAAQLAAL
jgi:ribonuclease PH